MDAPERKSGEQDLSERIRKIRQRKLRRELELYCADVTDPALRDEQGTMATPFFSLEKRKRTRPIEYERNGVQVTVAGLTTTGIATIWDADFLIWAASVLNSAIERGQVPSRRMVVTPYQFLLATGRIDPQHKGGKAYRDFESLLDRLQGTTIKTTIEAGGKTIKRAWSWIDYWEVVEDENGRMKGVEVVLSEWFFDRVVADKAILAINRAYFNLTRGIERWLYRLARKHCGKNPQGWSFTVRTLHTKYPTGREYRFFKRDLKAVVARDPLPEYRLDWEDVGGTDWIHFHRR